MTNAHRLWLLAGLSVLLAASSCRPAQPLYTFVDHVLTVPHGAGYYQITAFSENIIRVSYRDSTLSKPRTLAPTDSLPVRTTLAEKGNKLIFSTQQVRVEIQRRPVRIQFYDRGNGLKLSEAQAWSRRGDTTAFRFQLREEERIYGAGFRASGLNHRGLAFDHYNQPRYGYGHGEASLNYSVPVWLSSENYMLLVDNPAKGYFDIGATEEDVLEFGTLGGNQSYYFINGRSYPDLLAQYHFLTGHQELPPLWAFGNLQSRFGYRGQAETEAIVDQVLAAGYPIDAVIIDLYWFSKDARDGLLGNLSWDKDTWPDPEGMIRRFAELGIKTITVSEPFFVTTSRHFEFLDENKLLGLDAEGNTLVISDFFFGPAGLIDLFNPEARDWFWRHYQRHKALGVAGWWGDLGEPEKHPDTMYHVNGQATEIHGLYGHAWTRMLYEGYQRHYPDERFFMLARAGYAGTQRYGIIPWSGDVGRSWSGLRAQVPSLLNMSLSGLGYMHSDAGGFSKVEIVDTSLYRRWIQMAVFTPIFRPHGDADVAPPEPGLWDQETQEILRPYVRLRYQLLPYIYSLAWLNATRGQPLMRPLFFHYPEDARCDTLQTEYLFGRDLLVAPVLEPGQGAKKVYLPPGGWYDFWDDTYYPGGRDISIALSETELPVFARAGGTVTLAPAYGNTSAYRTDSLQLHHYYPPRNQRDTTYLYFDDGITPRANEEGPYHLISVFSERIEDNLEITLDAKGSDYAGAPRQRLITLTIHGFPKAPEQVLVDGEEIAYSREGRGLEIQLDLSLKQTKRIRIF